MKEKGLVAPSNFSVSNCKSKYETVEEETQARLEAVTEEAKVFKANLPVLLKRLSRIPDPRNPKKIKHKLTVLMLYGILVFVYQMSSRRQANEKMTNPIIIANLKLLLCFPIHLHFKRILCKSMSLGSIKIVGVLSIVKTRNGGKNE